MLGAIYRWRSDKALSLDSGDDWMAADSRVQIWDDVIAMMEDGSLRKGDYTNVLYADFIRDPGGTLTRAYADLGLTMEPAALKKMTDYMALRSQGKQGNSSKYQRTAADDPRGGQEREKYARYQAYFKVPDEV